MHSITLEPLFHWDEKHLRWVLSLAETPNAKFCIRNTNMLVSKNAKICVIPNANFEICVSPNAKPNATQWNVGCVESQTQISRIGHVLFIFFVLISFALGSQRELHFRWNMGLSIKKKLSIIAATFKTQNMHNLLLRIVPVVVAQSVKAIQ